MDGDEVLVHKKEKKTAANTQKSWPYKFGQESLYSRGLIIKGFIV